MTCGGFSWNIFLSWYIWLSLLDRACPDLFDWSPFKWTIVDCGLSDQGGWYNIFKEVNRILTNLRVSIIDFWHISDSTRILLLTSLLWGNPIFRISNFILTLQYNLPQGPCTRYIRHQECGGCKPAIREKYCAAVRFFKYAFKYGYSLNSSKQYSDQSPANGTLLDATNGAQDKFHQSICVSHRDMCVISVIIF